MTIPTNLDLLMLEARLQEQIAELKHRIENLEDYIRDLEDDNR
jgi:cell division protein FtsB